MADGAGGNGREGRLEFPSYTVIPSQEEDGSAGYLVINLGDPWGPEMADAFARVLRVRKAHPKLAERLARFASRRPPK